jgi:hypothetical protein
MTTVFEGNNGVRKLWYGTCAECGHVVQTFRNEDVVFDEETLKKLTKAMRLEF